jgi:hypothetical protein
MQKWEYLEVHVYYDGSGRKVSITVNGVEKFYKVVASTWYDYLNQLGEEGWELVNREAPYHYFKRPVA